MKAKLKALAKKIIGREFLIKRRVTAAGKFLSDGGLYLDILPQLLNDYRYSIFVTHRRVTQVANLEEVIQYIAQKKIPGAFVECGTFTGGASAFALLSMLRNETERRPYWGFDSFEGMPEPSEKDDSKTVVWMYGKKDGANSGKLVGSDVNFADYDECLNYLKGTGYPENQIHLVKGWFQDTLVKNKEAMGKIAVLRIDGDFYESTRVALEALYDSVVSRGAVIIDDYGSFAGCRKAVDEFLASRGVDPYLHYVDAGIRFFIKP